MSTIKVLAHGTGSGREAIAYLMRRKDSKGVKRKVIEVLVGDPAMTARLIDSLSTVQRYTSAVIAWHSEDKVTPDQMRRCVRQFVALARVGLDEDRLDVLAVRHDEHVHVIFPKVDLLTGLAYNPMPPGWEKSFGALRDFWNYENNWARPDDPARARTLQPGTSRVVANDPRSRLTKLVEDAVAAGNIVDRAGVMNLLSAHGAIIRNGRNYLSVQLDSSPRPLRLQGPLFARDFEVQAVIAIITRDRAEGMPLPSGCGVDPDTARARKGEASKRLSEAIRRRKLYVTKKYDSPRADGTTPVWVIEHPDRIAEHIAIEVAAKKQATAIANGRTEPAVILQAEAFINQQMQDATMGLRQRSRDNRPELPALLRGHGTTPTPASRVIEAPREIGDAGGDQAVDLVALRRDIIEAEIFLNKAKTAKPFVVTALAAAAKRYQYAQQVLWEAENPDEAEAMRQAEVESDQDCNNEFDKDNH